MLPKIVYSKTFSLFPNVKRELLRLYPSVPSNTSIFR